MNHDPTLSKTFGPSNVTPLISAATRGHIDVVNELLGRDSGLIELSKSNGKNALHFASRQGHVDIVKALLQKDPQLARRTDKKGQTALHMAVKGTSSGVVKALVDADPAIVMLPDKFGNTALHVATRKKRAEVFLCNFNFWALHICYFVYARMNRRSFFNLHYYVHASIYVLIRHSYKSRPWSTCAGTSYKLCNIQSAKF